MGRHLRRIRLCTYRIRCQQPVRRFHLPWLNCRGQKLKMEKKSRYVNTRRFHASFRRPVNAPRSHFLCNSPHPPLGGARGPTLRTGAEQKGNGAAFYHYHIRTQLVFRAALRLPAPWRSARGKRGAYREQTSLRPGRPLPPGQRTTSSASPCPIGFQFRTFEYSKDYLYRLMRHQLN